MKCPRCQHENPSDAVFCQECGARLEAACPSCGTPNQLSAKFCKKCGQRLSQPEAAQAVSGPRIGSPESYTPKHLAEKILTSRAALEGERKQVTVLFCDIANSTALAERLGPEVMHDLLSRFFKRALADVHHYEGTINQFLGDGFMALFGAPLAHEDHARRAVLAALALQRTFARTDSEAAESGLSIRIGINSGLVVVGKIGDNLRMDYTAVGDTTHLAARLQQSAETDTILVSEATWRLVAQDVRAEQVGPLSVKGITTPITVHKVLGLSSRRSALRGGEERTLTPFLGRQRELETLQALLDEAEHGRGQVIGLVGEPGVGKSRLLYEFQRSIAGRHITYLEGRCASYGRNVPYMLILEIVRKNCGIGDADTPQEISDKLHAALDEVEMDPAESAPFLLQLLGINEGTQQLASLTPDLIRVQTFEILRRMSLEGSKRRPIVFVGEDLHWLDTVSEEYLLSLVEALSGAAILLITTYRPGYRPPWLDKSYMTQLALRPLSQQDSLRVIEAVIARAPLADQLAKAILDKAEGNPFFIEELTRAIADRADTTVSPSVPDTIHDVLAARIDRLPEPLKHLLQTASVLGREFSLGLLADVAEVDTDVPAGLAELKRCEFLYVRAEANNLVYIFKHALTQDVAYGTLLHDRRRRLHTRAVDALARRAGRRLFEHVETLTHHAFHGEAWDKAVEYARQAAAKATARAANREAAVFLEIALDALGHLPQTRRTQEDFLLLRMHLCNAVFAVGELERMREELQQALTLAESLQDQRRVGQVLSLMGQYLLIAADYRRAIDCAERALATASAVNDVALQVRAGLYMGETLWAVGDYKRGASVLRTVINLLPRSSELRRFGNIGLPSVTARAALTWCLAELGDFDQVVEYEREVTRIATGDTHPISRLEAAWIGFAHWRRGDITDALALLEPALRLAREWEVPIHFAAVATHLGGIYTDLGRLTEALPLLEAAVKQSPTGYQIARGLFLGNLATWYFASNRLDEARRLAQQGLQVSLDRGERGHEAWIRKLLGDISERASSSSIAEPYAHFAGALSLAEELSMRPLVAHCHAGLAKLYRRTDKRIESDEHLNTATSMYRDMGMRYWLEKLDDEMKAPA